MMKERPMIPRLTKCSTCEKAHRMAQTCEVYPNAIPKKFRHQLDGVKNEAPACPDYEPEKDPDRWADPEWLRIMEEIRSGRPLDEE